MLGAVPHKSRGAAKASALAGACAATALVSAAGAVWGAARVARWAARLAPEDLAPAEFVAEDAPRVVVPLVKPGTSPVDPQGQPPQATSNYDVGETMQKFSGAVKA